MWLIRKEKKNILNLRKKEYLGFNKCDFTGANSRGWRECFCFRHSRENGSLGQWVSILFWMKYLRAWIPIFMGMMSFCHSEQNEVERGNPGTCFNYMDCFVAVLLTMTKTVSSYRRKSVSRWIIRKQNMESVFTWIPFFNGMTDTKLFLIFSLFFFISSLYIYTTLYIPPLLVIYPSISMRARALTTIDISSCSFSERASMPRLSIQSIS
jgi:hypothetical protein